VFKSKQAAVVELSPECQEALVRLEDDTATLTELLGELIQTQRQIVAAIRAEVPDVVPLGENGQIEVFAEAPPEVFATSQTGGDGGDVRESPFGRAPRSVQIEWLRKVMADGAWYSALTIADHYATDERHRRYMKGALNGRLREMYEDHEVERRDSHTRGAMYEFRLRRAGS